MIEKIEAYKTSDGVVFEDYIAASIHEEEYQEYMEQHPNEVLDKCEYLTACGKYISLYEKKFTINELIASNFKCILDCTRNYIWYNIETKMVYVGESKNLKSRVREFVRNFTYSGNSRLDSDRMTCGNEKRWILFLLNLNIDESDLRQVETELMLEYDSLNPLHGYNTCISKKINKI